MEIRGLEGTSLDIIFHAFKEAFNNYVIPLDLDRDLHLKRWKTAGVDFSLSYGVFDQEELVAFVLHVPVDHVLFNFGTGVVPSHRGQKLIEKIYDVAVPHLKNFKEVKLEVIKGNDRAIALYERMGFQTTRELLSFQGELNICCGPTNAFHYHVRPLGYTQEMKDMRLFEPASEASKTVLMKAKENHETHELRYGDTLVAYAVYTPYNGSLREMGAIDPIDRHLDQLLLHMKLGDQRIRVMNVEDRSQTMIHFWMNKGLINFVTQFEMRKEL
ncbi:GNAT family N-acetyltransferase [Peredibacter sp. HCB2-198]|uniref:GNAT family N-acetyltransferase n=1 Tax=Peredibacter sp. HCB2-198 TaxID=3383025 RepID=UPI0038B4E17A